MPDYTRRHPVGFARQRGATLRRPGMLFPCSLINRDSRFLIELIVVGGDKFPGCWAPKGRGSLRSPPKSKTLSLGLDSWPDLTWRAVTPFSVKQIAFVGYKRLHLLLICLSVVCLWNSSKKMLEMSALIRLKFLHLRVGHNITYQQQKVMLTSQSTWHNI